jgi:methanol--5-hydroxybenzimidazolylcobamide Co-methyltransferase
MCDLWSNESVQNIRLLSGNAPEAFAELLAYDCRLMNTATRHGQQSMLRDWLTDSDEHLSPQALLLSPASTLRIARAIVSVDDVYGRTIAAGKEAVAILKQAQASGDLALPAREKSWLNRLEAELENLPSEEGPLLAEMAALHGSLFDCASYGL